MSERGFVELERIDERLPAEPRRFQIRMAVPELQEWLKFGEGMRLMEVRMDHATGEVCMTVETSPPDAERYAETMDTAHSRCGLDPGTAGCMLRYFGEGEGWNWHHP